MIDVASVDAEGTSQKWRVSPRCFEHDKLSGLYFSGDRGTVDIQEEIVGFDTLVFYDNATRLHRHNSFQIFFTMRRASDFPR